MAQAQDVTQVPMPHDWHVVDIPWEPWNSPPSRFVDFLEGEKLSLLAFRWSYYYGRGSPDHPLFKTHDVFFLRGLSDVLSPMIREAVNAPRELNMADLHRMYA
jgi:hypothetical protein